MSTAVKATQNTTSTARLICKKCGQPYYIQKVYRARDTGLCSRCNTNARVRESTKKAHDKNRPLSGGELGSWMMSFFVQGYSLNRIAQEYNRELGFVETEFQRAVERCPGAVEYYEEKGKRRAERRRAVRQGHG